MRLKGGRDSALFLCLEYEDNLGTIGVVRFDLKAPNACLIPSPGLRPPSPGGRGGFSTAAGTNQDTALAQVKNGFQDEPNRLLSQSALFTKP